MRGEEAARVFCCRTHSVDGTSRARAFTSPLPRATYAMYLVSSSASGSESGAGARDEEGVEALTMSCVETGTLVVAETERKELGALTTPLNTETEPDAEA